MAEMLQNARRPVQNPVQGYDEQAARFRQERDLVPQYVRSSTQTQLK
jgi:hypothetical protein